MPWQQNKKKQRETIFLTINKQCAAQTSQRGPHLKIISVLI